MEAAELAIKGAPLGTSPGQARSSHSQDKFFGLKKDIKKMRIECRPRASAIRTFVLIIACIRNAERVNFGGIFLNEKFIDLARKIRLNQPQM